MTFNYRGSWGSPGRFGFGHVLEDTAAALAFLRDPAEAARLRADPARIVLAGHGMGGWATLLMLTSDDGLAPAADALVATLLRDGATHVTALHVATDHGWSDHRIALQVAVLDWLADLH